MKHQNILVLAAAVLAAASLRAAEIDVVSALARHLNTPARPAGYLDDGAIDILKGEGAFVRTGTLDTYYDFETKELFGYESIDKRDETIPQTFERFKAKVAEFEKATGLKYVTGVYKPYSSGKFEYDFASVSNATGEAYVYCHYFPGEQLGMVQWGARRPLPPKKSYDPFGAVYRAEWSDELNREIDARIEQYRKDDVDITLAGVPAGTKVKVEQLTSDFQVGCNIFNFDQLGDAEQNAAYRDAFRRDGLFNAATVPFYWHDLEPKRGQPRYRAGVEENPDYWKTHGKGDPAWRRPSPEKVLDFCAANDVSVHGHVIIYPGVHPAWVNAEKDGEKRMQLYADHIREIAKVYGETIPQWDIVNESVDRASTASAPHDTLPWCKIAQPKDYTLRSFKAAAAAFPPSVKLCINDAYTGPSDDGRYPAFTRKLLKDGARIDVIGHQMHIFSDDHVARVASGDAVRPNHLSWRIKDQLAMLRQYDEIGKPIHVSEVTIPAPVSVLPRAEAEALQARVLRDNYRLWFSWPSVYRISYWNAVDSIGGEILESGFFRRDMTKKPVYDTLWKLVHEEWRTKTEVAVEQGGRLRFRGFKGAYRLTWKDAQGIERTRLVRTGKTDDGETTAGVPLAPRPAKSDGQLVVFDKQAVGPVKVMNAVNGSPGGREGTVNFAAWKAAEIPYARTHDYRSVGGYGGHHTIDISGVFPNFDADENDPKSYEFACSDDVIARTYKAGTKIFYRLGQTIEGSFVKKYDVYPPKDFAKWARIAEHIIAHYTEGWADGYRYDMEYWEIWNEPDLNTAKDEPLISQTWRGTRKQFKEFWLIVQKHLKTRFPHLKVGGPALAGTHEWGRELMVAMKERNIPVDFYSWHGYSSDPKLWVATARKVRAMLDELGFEKCESIYNEWNYVKGWGRDMAYSLEVERGRYNQKGAAYVGSVMNVMQNEPVDMLMYYDARPNGMNGMFEMGTQLPMRCYYNFYAWAKLRRLGTQVKTSCDLDDVYVTAARDAKGRLGVFVVRYDEDNNVTYPIRLTVRLASGRSLKDANCHLTDDIRIYTEVPPEVHEDGSVDLVLRPCSFAYLSL